MKPWQSQSFVLDVLEYDKRLPTPNLRTVILKREARDLNKNIYKYTSGNI